MEPPARIELATSSLPMRCYTTKPRWRRPCHQAFRYNHFASSLNHSKGGQLAPRERFELPRDGPTRFPVARALPGYAISARNFVQPSSPFNAHPCKESNTTDSKVNLLGLTWTVEIQRHRNRLLMPFLSVWKRSKSNQCSLIFIR